MDETKLFEMLAKLRDTFNGAAMAIDETIQTEGKKREEEPARQMIDYDLAKITWAETKPGRNGEPTWYADNVTNKDSVDFQRLVETMKKAREGKGNPEPFYFWTKMPEGKGFLWFDQNNNGIYRRFYRRLKKA